MFFLKSEIDINLIPLIPSTIPEIDTSLFFQLFEKYENSSIFENNFGLYKIVIEKEEDNIFSDDEYILKKVFLNNDELEEFIQSDNDNYAKLNIKFRKEFPDLLNNPQKEIPKEEKENPSKDFESSYNKNESKKKLEEKIEKKKKEKNKSDKREKHKDEEKENNKNNENDIESFLN